MEYNYLVTYKARKNKEDKEINSTIPIILDCPIYQPEVLMHVEMEIQMISSLLMPPKNSKQEKIRIF